MLNLQDNLLLEALLLDRARKVSFVDFELKPKNLHVLNKYHVWINCPPVEEYFCNDLKD